MSTRIRFARGSDAVALRGIYAQYIDTGITFAGSLPSVKRFERDIRLTRLNYPYLVLEEEGKAVGYAYAHRFREREAYQWSAELSIYLARDAMGRGLGEELYQRLIMLMRPQNIKIVYALVTGANPGSLRFHDRMGFDYLGCHEKVGYKAGEWVDMHWYAMRLGEQEGEPEPFVPFSRVELQTIRALMRKPLKNMV